MCKIFWCEIEKLILSGHLSKFDISHVSNGQKAGKSKLARMLAGKEDKAMGVVRGVHDYNLPSIGTLEAKRYVLVKGKIQKTYLAAEQKEYRAYILSKGLKFDVFRTPQEGIDILRNWGVISQ